MRYRLLLALPILAGSVIVTPLSRVHAGEEALVVIDAGAGLALRGALFLVDPATGDRAVLSDFGDARQGAGGQDPVAVALDAAGSVLVVDRTAGTGQNGALIRIDGGTGLRTVLSDFGNPRQGVLGSRPAGVAVESSGVILVTDPSAGPRSKGLLFRVDSRTGTRTVLSNFDDPRQGPTGDDPVGLAVEASGSILVTDAGAARAGVLFRVHPTTGARVVVSDFADPAQGPTGSAPAGVAIDASGAILVIDPNAGFGLNGALFRVDASTGARTLVSDFGDGRQGPTANSPGDIAIDASGSIVVTDATVGSGGAVFRVDPVSGARDLVSDLGALSQGPLGESPGGVLAVTVANPS